MEIGFLSHALFKIDRHAANAYPHEAYGFCLGVTDLAIVCVALPVGETARRGGSSEQFRDLGLAFAPAQKLAFSCNMDILAIYHSHSDLVAQTPLAFVPKEFMEKPVLVQEIFEGEPVPPDYYYVKEINQGWHKCEVKTAARRIHRAEVNPRRIMSMWKLIWDTENQASSSTNRIETLELKKRTMQ